MVLSHTTRETPVSLEASMDENEKDHLGRGLLAGVALTSLATLFLQISLTRLFSVTLWHHFAFMVVSIAFLGFAASGTFLMMVPQVKALPFRQTLSWIALCFSMTTLVAYGCSNIIPFDPARMMWDRYQWVYILGYYGSLAIPFFFAGLILALVYSGRPRRTNQLYACDLAGAGLGCMALFVTYPFAGEAGNVLVVSLLSALASLAFHPKPWRMNLVRLPWMLTVGILLITKPGFLAPGISPYKPLVVALRYPDAHLLETRWHPAARVDIVQSGAVRFAPGLSLEFRGDLPEQLGLCLDAGHLNAVTRLTQNTEKLAFIDALPASLPYQIAQPNHVLIMEPIGGLDVLMARYHGAKTIVTTHGNPAVLWVMRHSLNDFSGGLYETEATVIEEQARSFLRRTPHHFDVIQLPVTDTLGAASSGLYGLSEDYDLTVDAFKVYLEALAPGGFLAATRYLLPPPRHELRLLALACAALEALGINQPEKHVGAIRTWSTFTLLVKRTPFEPQEIERMQAFCRRLRFDLVYYPEMQRREANIYNRFPSPLYHDMTRKILIPSTRDDFFKTYLFDLQPVTDDRPFFYHNFRMDKARLLYQAVGNKWQLFVEGGYLVHLIFLQAMVISLVLIILPVRRIRTQPLSPVLLYFGLIGLGFMLTEICLIQRFILFLARPTYAFSGVLFAILTASAVGSYYSKKGLMKGKDDGPLLKHCLYKTPAMLMTPVLLLAYVFLLDGLLEPAISWPLWMRYFVAFLAIFPLGFTMGMFFPVGVHILSLQLEAAIPWAWAINASISVAGSVLAVVIALSYGFTVVLCVAAVAYSLAVVVLSWMMRWKTG